MPDFLNFTALGFDPILHPDRVLNSFQRRLAHQYIKTEHPDLVTITRQGFMQIVAYDKEQEDANQRYRNRIFDEKMVKQVGLRWIVEAICGGDLSTINPYNFHTTVKSRQEKVAADFIRVREQLMGNSTVLVGHNLFLDLIYFHACFFGPLPDKVEDFQRAIHDLFPRIIDTKYLATHNISDPVLADSSLEKLDERLSKQEEPCLGMLCFYLNKELSLTCVGRIAPRTSKVRAYQASPRSWLRQLSDSQSSHPPVWKSRKEWLVLRGKREEPRR